MHIFSINYSFLFLSILNSIITNTTTIGTPPAHRDLYILHAAHPTVRRLQFLIAEETHNFPVKQPIHIPVAQMTMADYSPRLLFPQFIQATGKDNISRIIF